VPSYFSSLSLSRLWAQQGDHNQINGNSSSRNSISETTTDEDMDYRYRKNEEDREKNEKTLYDVLGATSDMSRAELKRCYAECARRTHPDAQINSGGSSTMMMGADSGQEESDFNEVANAWRILGNTKLRKRYDRELKAKEWSARAQQLTNERLEQGFDVASNVIETLASVPFLRRTSQALAGLSSSSSSNNNDNGQNDVSGRKSQQYDLTQAFLSMIRSRKDGGTSIGTVELSDKSDELERRAREEEERATQITEQLNRVTKERLLATLQSSSVALTSDEAQILLEGLAINDTVSLVDRALLKTTVENEISSLRETEELFSEKLQSYDETDKEWNFLLEKQEVAKDDLLRKKNFEIEARKTLEKAQQGVIEAKENLVQTSNALRVVEQQVRKTAQEMDQITTRLTKRQEKVRDALRKKTELMESGIQVKYLDDDELAALRKKELQLLNERQEAQEMVTRLQSRAEKLKARADALESWKGTI
jgi:curved DNA-binding protein CbpA